MIAISCLHCNKKLNVKDELAGKKIRCPQCKQVLEIPARLSECATVPPSASRQRQDKEDATLAPSWSPPPDAEPAHDSPRHDQADDRKEATETLATAANYQVAGEIARGGMGAIMRAVDEGIRREVAIKFLLDHADDRQKARFVEEAQITGQLEHPNIVPIHHLGTHEDGRCFFSMKMVKGRSLADILKDEHSAYTLGRLLNIMINICNAIAYAHSRQVIHRDLKPANIMVGDFGEVYVMDWGLAKVLGKEEMPPTAATTQAKGKKAHADTMPGKAPDSKSWDRVTTRGRSEDEQTQAGAIMGTPAYMPPEQAQGKLEEVDERSDIYSLGAILYEMMTLTPPVGRGGAMVEIIMRVVEGKIDPPPERAPERARAGWIPPELSAIALKALARKPKNRYQDVEQFRRDIELFLEGRSVSAKQDTAWEMFKKLVKRNKGASIATATALVVMLVVVGFFLKINYEARVAADNARVVAEKANADFLAEQDARRAQGRQSAPTFLEDARHSTAQRKIEHALAQVNVALDYDPDLTDAWLLKGQLLIGQKKFGEARKYLISYLQRQPDDTNAKKLMDLCIMPNADDVAVLVEFSETLTRQKAFALAETMIGHAGDLKDVGQRMFKLYQQRLDSAWKGSGDALTIDGNAKMSLDLGASSDLVTDLSPLQGMKIHALGLRRCRKINDLGPLAGMPLTWLNLEDCNGVADLAPLKGMPLTELNLGGCSQVHDLTPLTGIKLTALNLEECAKIRDLTPLRGMKLLSLSLTRCDVSDLSPLTGMPLTSLNLTFCGKVTDLSPLKSLKLSTLSLNGCSLVSDFAPLTGMPLTELDLRRCTIQDLTLLTGMKLVSLNLWGLSVRDLTPLRGMKLQALSLARNGEVNDLSPLAGMPLTWLELEDCPKVNNLEPLQGMKLEDIRLPPTVTKGLEVLRNMNSLKTINGMPAAQFWKKHDAKKSL